MNILKKVLATYIQNVKNYTPVRLIVEFWVLSVFWKLFLVVSVVGALSVVFFIGGGETEELVSSFLVRDNDPIAELYLIETVIIVPILETLFFQALLIWLMLKKGIKTKKIVLISSVIFALSHVYPMSIMFAFGTGILLASVYVIGLRHSVARAIVLTAVLHASVNATAELLYYFVL